MVRRGYGRKVIRHGLFRYQFFAVKFDSFLSVLSG